MQARSETFLLQDLIKALCITKLLGKKKGQFLDRPHLLNQTLHMTEIALEGASTSGGQFVFCLRQTPFEEFCARDVTSFFELACVYAQISVSRIHEILQIAKAQ